ncbi:MAG TPA: tryptophan-rich sensory protein [Streptosporangiaceae bacterium]|nr:tryptophan-rich sensory protein [Streptosporangiaceae bacterium]
MAWWALAVSVRSGYVPLAFGRRRLWAATADSALLCAVMAHYASQARRVDRAAAALAVPEIAWTAFATVLSGIGWRSRPRPGRDLAALGNVRLGSARGREGAGPVDPRVHDRPGKGPV